MENPTTIAVDLSKNVFEIAVESQGRICQRKRLNRRQLVEFFSQSPSATVLMETCGSSHYWGRKAQEFGHTVKLLPLNTVRGLLREFGVTIAEGAERVLPGVREALSESPSPVPESLHAALFSMMAEAGKLEERSRQVEKQLKALSRTVPLVERLEEIPGIGLLNATAFSAQVGNYPRFKSGREFASSLGLTPKESSSGKRRWLGSISKAGDPYLRTLLIGGARSMILAAHRTKRPHRLQAWALEVEKRRGRNRAAVAVANKLARIIWAISTRGVPFKPQFDIQNAPKTVPA